MRSLPRCGLAFAAVALAAGVARSQTSTETVAASPSQLAAFDHAWQRVRDTYPDPGMKGLDWQAVREELRPLAAAASTAAEVRPVIQAMLDRLGESHFLVIPGDGGDAPSFEPGDIVGEAGDLGLDVRLMPLGARRGAHEGLVVTRVAPGGAAWAAGLRPGLAVLRLDGLDVRRMLREHRAVPGDERGFRVRAVMAVHQAQIGTIGRLAEVVALDGDGREVTVRMRRRRPAGEINQLGNLPPMPVELEHGLVPGTRVGLIRFSIFLAPVSQPFGLAVVELSGAGMSGLVVDVRGNPGGIAALVMGLAGHFVDQPGQVLGRMRTREAYLEFAAIPRAPAERWAGPLAILVDEMSISTAELFAGGLQGIGRARVFGTTTAGMALPSVLESLPNGDRLQFVLADLVGPSGRRIEGRGVVPDEVVALSRAALLAGEDPVLSAAVRWIESGRSGGHREERRP